jgi:hypothetical protein
MISLEMARQLREAGLSWRPTERDTFALADHDMDDQVFVVSPLPAIVQIFQGQPAIAFQASPEWALDYVMLSQVLWLPTEYQLRSALEARIDGDGPLSLERAGGGYRCTIGLGGASQGFDGPDAETAYAQALIAALIHEG